MAVKKTNACAKECGYCNCDLSGQSPPYGETGKTKTYFCSKPCSQAYYRSDAEAIFQELDINLKEIIDQYTGRETKRKELTEIKRIRNISLIMHKAVFKHSKREHLLTLLAKIQEPMVDYMEKLQDEGSPDEIYLRTANFFKERITTLSSCIDLFAR